jgi:hypothetical protein
MEGGEKKVKPAFRVFFALVALGAGMTGCKKEGVHAGDQGIVVGNNVSCLSDAPSLIAENPPKNHGLIQKGTVATVTVDEKTEMFGATANLGTYLYVEIPDDKIAPSGIIHEIAKEQGMAPIPNAQPQKQGCWIPTTSFSPIKK